MNVIRVWRKLGVMVLLHVFVVPLVVGIGFGSELPGKKSKTPAVQRETKTYQDEWNGIVTAAKKEARLIIYTGWIGEARDAINKAFGEKYGISVEFIQGRGSELVLRLDTERRNGIYQADVGFQGLTTFFNQMQAMIMTVPLAPLFVLPEVKDPTKWRGGKIPFVDRKMTVVTFALTVQPHVVINTSIVKDDEIKSNEDLLAPKWKGKILINDPTLAGNGASWFSYLMLRAYDRPRAEDYIKKLIAQEPVILRDQRIMIEWVARGKHPIGIACEPAETIKMMRSGAPMKFVRIREGMPVTSGPMNLMAFDRAPHPNATKLFVNWALSREGVDLLSYAAGYPALRLDVSTERFDPLLVPGPRDAAPNEAYKQQEDELTKVAAEIFKGLLH